MECAHEKFSYGKGKIHWNTYNQIKFKTIIQFVFADLKFALILFRLLVLIAEIYFGQNTWGNVLRYHNWNLFTQFAYKQFDKMVKYGNQIINTRAKWKSFRLTIKIRLHIGFLWFSEGIILNYEYVRIADSCSRGQSIA